MKLCIVICVVLGSHHVTYGQWHNRVYLEEAVQFFDKAVQETFLELEERGFCNLKLLDYTQTISQQMYKWLVAGNVTYANGFVVSIQKIDVTDVQQSANTRTVDGETYTFASIQGHVNLRDLKVGYDVIAELGEDGEHRFTGTFVHTLVRLHYSCPERLRDAFDFPGIPSSNPDLVIMESPQEYTKKDTTNGLNIQKNLNTQEITVTQSLNSLSGGLDRMVYMPANNITQVISRTYVPSNAWDGITAWRDVIVPIITHLIMTRIAYPPVCLDCR